MPSKNPIYIVLLGLLGVILWLVVVPLGREDRREYEALVAEVAESTKKSAELEVMVAALQSALSEREGQIEVLRQAQPERLRDQIRRYEQEIESLRSQMKKQEARLGEVQANIKEALDAKAAAELARDIAIADKRRLLDELKPAGASAGPSARDKWLSIGEKNVNLKEVTLRMGRSPDSPVLRARINKTSSRNATIEWEQESWEREIFPQFRAQRNEWPEAYMPVLQWFLGNFSDDDSRMRELEVSLWSISEKETGILACVLPERIGSARDGAGRAFVSLNASLRPGVVKLPLDVQIRNRAWENEIHNISEESWRGASLRFACGELEITQQEPNKRPVPRLRESRAAVVGVRFDRQGNAAEVRVILGTGNAEVDTQIYWRVRAWKAVSRQSDLGDLVGTELKFRLLWS